jgi:hypothetical protein
MMAERTAKRKRLRLGDVLEIRSPRGYAYVQYLGRHEGYGAAIYVYPAWHKSRLESFDALKNARGYLTFYPAQSAALQGLVEIVGTLPVRLEESQLYVFRRRGARNRDGQVLAWIIERDGKETLKRKLTAADRKLPIASVWNHEYLIDRISTNWHPEQEG